MNKNNPHLDRETVKNALGILTERERQVIEHRFGFVDGYTKTTEEVARQFKVTPERIAEIENKALQKISDYQA